MKLELLFAAYPGRFRLGDPTGTGLQAQGHAQRVVHLSDSTGASCAEGHKRPLARCQGHTGCHFARVHPVNGVGPGPVGPGPKWSGAQPGGPDARWAQQACWAGPHHPDGTVRSAGPPFPLAATDIRAQILRRGQRSLFWLGPFGPPGSVTRTGCAVRSLANLKVADGPDAGRANVVEGPDAAGPAWTGRFRGI
jgi:hypothetical protein